jgi:hypothetical protein
LQRGVLRCSVACCVAAWCAALQHDARNCNIASCIAEWCAAFQRLRHPCERPLTLNPPHARLIRGQSGRRRVRVGGCVVVCMCLRVRACVRACVCFVCACVCLRVRAVFVRACAARACAGERADGPIRCRHRCGSRCRCAPLARTQAARRARRPPGAAAGAAVGGCTRIPRHGIPLLAWYPRGAW